MIKVSNTAITSVEVDGKQQNLLVVGDTAVFNAFQDTSSWFINGRPMSDTDDIHEEYDANTKDVGPSSGCAIAMQFNVPTSQTVTSGSIFARLLIPNEAYYEVEINGRRTYGSYLVRETVYVRKYAYQGRGVYSLVSSKTKSFVKEETVLLYAQARLYLVPSYGYGDSKENDFSVRYHVEFQKNVITEAPILETYDGYCDDEDGATITPTKHTSTKSYTAGDFVIKNGYKVQDKHGQTSSMVIACSKTEFTPIS